jgi:hypothetical protein
MLSGERIATVHMTETIRQNARTAKPNGASSSISA